MRHFFRTDERPNTVPMLFPVMPKPSLSFQHPTGSSPWDRAAVHYFWLLDQYKSLESIRHQFKCNEKPMSNTCKMARIYRQSLGRRLELHRNTPHYDSINYNNVFVDDAKKIRNEKQAEGYLLFRLGSLANGGNFTSHKNAHAAGFPLFPFFNKPLAIGLAVLKVGVSVDLPETLRSFFISMGYFVGSCLDQRCQALTIQEYLDTNTIVRSVQNQSNDKDVLCGWSWADKSSNAAFAQVSACSSS